jgi:acetolactate synthase I/II/III large subunit
MKLAEYVIDFLARQGVSHVFGMSGGAAVHLFDAAARHPDVTPVFGQHEQSSAMSADGFARITGRLGVAITTSGPGATNLLTGTCCSFYDSVPTLMLTGQVATHRLKGDRAVRQVGFQETDVLSIFGTVTKHAEQLRAPQDIRAALERALFHAFEGRPGSVLLDIPDDLQRAEIDPATLVGFTPPASGAEDFAPAFAELAALLARAERPALVLGGGLSTPRVGPELAALIDRLDMPVLATWAGLDCMGHDHPNFVGPFGVYGPRLGNYVVQNADLLLCLGTRLSQNVTGGILESFACSAHIVMVDADVAEMAKFDGRGIRIATRIAARLDRFVPAWLASLGNAPPARPAWHARIEGWRESLPRDDAPAPPAGRIDAQHLVAELPAVLGAEEAVFVDTGGTLTWTCNGLRLRPGQRLVSAWNNTPMGYALPAAIGAAMATGVPNSCVIGDGGLMLCLGELATLVRHRLPVRVVLFNNAGHGIQKQTLETWLGGNYVGVDEASGLAFTDFAAVGRAMGLPVFVLDAADGIAAGLAAAYATDGPVLIDARVMPAQKLYPVLKFGAALENQLPAMDPEQIAREMVIPPYAGAVRAGGTPGV